MSDVCKQICRLCLEVVPEGNCEPISEIDKEILEVLLINIDFHISDNDACKMCMRKLQDCFDFKSTCFYVDDYITPFVYTDVRVDIKKVFQKVMTKENVNLENMEICRLCMTPIENNAFIYNTDMKDAVPAKAVIRNSLPEVDLNTVNDPLICELCLSSAERLNDFMKICQEVEQSIKSYCHVAAGQDILGRISLDNLLKFKCSTTLSTPIAIKNYSSDAENGLKCPKEEATVRVEGCKSDQSEVCNSSTKSGSSEKKRKNRKSTKEKKQLTYFCPKCPYSSSKYVMTLHMRRHTDNEEYKCTLCDFVTNAKLSLKAHLRSHRGPNMAYGCPKCPYETNHKYSLDNHLLKHKDKSEVKMRKCPLCPYESKYKTAVLTHRKLEHSGNIKMYNCTDCSYTSKYKKSIVIHQLLHKNPEEIPMYKCANCKFKAKQKYSLVKHMRMHEDPKVPGTFKCRMCRFVAKTQFDLNSHMLFHSADKRPYSCDECAYTSDIFSNVFIHKRIHQSDAERQMFKCELCSFQAKHTRSIQYHMITTHTDPSEVQKLKCAHCSYEATLKHSLIKHIRRWHANKPTLKCELCPYTSKLETDLRKHSIVHKDIKLQCAHCDFWTKHKSYLRVHMRQHNPSLYPMLKCDQCEYHAGETTSLNRHRLTHMELGETTVYHCATCNFKTKSKKNIEGHTKVCTKIKKKNRNKKKGSSSNSTKN